MTATSQPQPPADAQKGAALAIARRAAHEQRVGPLGRPRFLATFPRIFAGTHTSAKDIEQTRCRTIDLELDGPVDCMVDGEILKVRLRRLELMSHALEVML